MELYEQIRREYEHGAGTIRAVARKLGMHRREVRKALASAMPAERRIPERERPKLAEAIPFIDAILESDRKAPRKQRHTAHRMWTRLRRELPEVAVAESTVLNGESDRWCSGAAAEGMVPAMGRPSLVEAELLRPRYTFGARPTLKGAQAEAAAQLGSSSRRFGTQTRRDRPSHPGPGRRSEGDCWQHRRCSASR